MDDQENMLVVDNLTVELDNQRILENINFIVAKGDIMAIIGPNGAGKSVLFRALLGLIPYSGHVKWHKDAKLGYVPQKAFIERGFPLTVKEFFDLKSKDQKEMLEVLKLVGIITRNHEENHLEHHILKRRIGLLSGGELQRVLIAWSLIGHPNILLFDEPTAGIDIGGEETIYTLLHELEEKESLTIILISHDLNIVYKYANKVMCLNKQQICFGEPHIVLDPEELASIYGGKAKFYHHKHHFENHT